MIEQGFLKKHFVGRDGFVWWIGQIVSEDEWVINYSGGRTETTSDHLGFDWRYKVRIMGYHGDEITDPELPWASLMFPVTAGSGSRGCSQTPNLSQGDFVYGFFLDGDDAQTPVIMGVIGNNQYVSILKSPPQSPFIPFSGFTNRDSVPRYSLPTSQEDGLAKQTSNPEASSPSSNRTTVQSSVGLQSRKDGASLEAYTEGKQKIDLPVPSSCDPSPISKVPTIIKQLISGIERIKATTSKWRDKVSTKIQNVENKINKLIDKATKFISGAVKTLVTNIQGYIIDKINNGLKDLYYIAFPNQRPAIKAATEKANDLIACLFRKIISNLLKMVGKFLKGAVDKLLTAPICAVENFVGGLLGKLTGFITSSVDSILGPIKALTGAAFDLADGVIGFVTGLLNLLSCDETPKCAELKEWSAWDGPSNVPSIDINSLVNKAKSFASTAKNAASAIDPDNFNFDLDFSDVFQDTCNVGALFCGPPTVEFFGGGGNGTTGNAIISATGSILGVDIITPGSGYGSAPTVRFVDACGKGRGAYGKTVLNSNGEVDYVIMEQSGTGYLPISDGSRGGDGRVFANPGDTIVKRADGTYDPAYSPGQTIQLSPGDEVQIGTELPYISPGAQTIVAPTITNLGGDDAAGLGAGIVTGVGAGAGAGAGAGVGGIGAGGAGTGGAGTGAGTGFGAVAGGGDGANTGLAEVAAAGGTGTGTGAGFGAGGAAGSGSADAGTNLSGSSGTGLTGSGLNVFGDGNVIDDNGNIIYGNPINTLGEYPVYLEIRDVYISDPGFDYQPGDSIKISPSNGALINPKFDELGSIIGVDIKNGGLGFKDIPEIFIESQTGFNAKLIPIFRVNRIGPPTAENIARNNQKDAVVSVLNCVGKFNV